MELYDPPLSTCFIRDRLLLSISEILFTCDTLGLTVHKEEPEGLFHCS